jgi:energy-coupling factor transporter ATP-binding protein EcfA2
VYWDSLTYYRVYRIYLNLKKNYDEITIITGYEGSGKSVLASQIATTVSPQFTKNRIGYDPSDLPACFKDVQKGDTVWLDEGALFLFSRNATKKENKIIIQLLSIVRQMNLHLIICVPNFFVVDTYLRDHRVKNLIHIHKNRKAFLWFKRDAISYLNYHGKTVKNVTLGFKHIPPHWAFVGNWTKDFGETDFFTEKDYLSAKHTNMDKFMTDIYSQLGDDEDVFSDLEVFKRDTNYSTPSPTPSDSLKAFGGMLKK